jgi:hypothetical protein
MEYSTQVVIRTTPWVDDRKHRGQHIVLTRQKSLNRFGAKGRIDPRLCSSASLIARGLTSYA